MAPVWTSHTWNLGHFMLTCTLSAVRAVLVGPVGLAVLIQEVELQSESRRETFASDLHQHCISSVDTEDYN